MRSIIMALGLLISPVFAHADQASMEAMLTSMEGTWSGSGSVVIRLGKAGTYPIQVTQTTTATAADTWQVQTTITGMPTPSSTLTQYTIKNGKLDVWSTQYEVIASVQKSANNLLSYTTSHKDPVNGSVVKNTKSYTLGDGGSQTVTSAVYNNGQLVQTFQYELAKSI